MYSGYVGKEGGIAVAPRYNLDDFSANRRYNTRKSAAKRVAVKSVKRGPSAPKRSIPKRNSSNRRPSVQRGKRSAAFTFLVILLVVIVVALIGFISFNIYREYRKGLPFTYSDGVKVSGIDIGGLSVKDAREKLKTEALTAVKDFNAKVRAKSFEKTYTKSDFKYTFDFETPLKSAKIYSMKEQGIYDSKKSKTKVETDESTDSPEFTLKYKVTSDSIRNQSKAVAKKVDIAPNNARVTKFHPFAENRFEYKEGSAGYKLDQNALNKSLKSVFSSEKTDFEFNAKVDRISPSITVNDLKTKIIGLSTASTVSQNTPSGTHNMTVAMKACNGSVIEPGATWSFNKCTGDSNLESNGYKKAAVISEKKIEQGTGGGICQASTIIFEAGLFSNMEIIERHNHYWASTYAYAGEDATIDYPTLDLKMRNKTDYQMFMECRVETGNRLRVNIWGYQDPDYDNIRIHSENFDVSKTDFNSRLFRELFKGGKIIKTEVVCDSHYSIKNSVKTPDAETYRTRVDGYVQYEDEDYIPMDTGESEDSAEEDSEEEDSGEDNGEETAEDENYFDEESE